MFLISFGYFELIILCVRSAFLVGHFVLITICVCQPMSMVRNSFRDRKEGYTDKAVVIRFFFLHLLILLLLSYFK